MFFTSVFMVCLALVEITSQQHQQRQKLNVLVLIENHHFHTRSLQICVANEIKAVNSGKWSFLKDFYLDAQTESLSKNLNDLLSTLCRMLNTQTNTIVVINFFDHSELGMLNNQLFLKYTHYLNIPTLVFNPISYQTNDPRSNEIQLSPTLNHQAEAILALLFKYEWLKYTIIVSELSGFNDFVKAFKKMTEYRGKKFKILSIIKLKKDDEHREILSKFRSIKYETRVFLIHCGSNEVNKIFKVANQLGLTTHEHIWIFTRNSIELINKNLKYPMGSLALSYNVSGESICQNVVSNSFRVWSHALEKYYKSNSKDNINMIVPHTACWNASKMNNLMKYHFGSNFYDYLVNASVDRRQNAPLIFNQKGVLDSVQFKILNLNAKNEWKEVGTWVNKTILMDDITWPGALHKPPMGRPMKFHLNIVTIEEQPFVIFKDTVFSNTSCLENTVAVRIGAQNSTVYKCASGFYIDLLKMLQEKLDFTYDIYEVEDKKWGGKVNGSWNGLVRDLMSGKADIAMTSLKITEERSQAIDFTVPFMETGIAIIVAKRPGSISATAFLKPYDYLIWLLILLVFIHSVAISVFLFDWIKVKLFKSQSYMNSLKLRHFVDNRVSIKQTEIESFSFGLSLWLVWVLLFRAATEFSKPKSFTSKFMVNIWACFCMAFMASYTANLAAFMITQEEFYELKGIEDDRLINPLIHEPPLRFGTVRHGSTEEVLKKNYPNMMKYMSRYMQTNISDGIKALKENKIDCFIYDAVVLDFRSGHDEDCKLQVVGNWYSMTGYGLAVSKGSIYREMLDRKILEYSYSGELERSQKFWFSGVCKNKQEDSKSGSHPLDVLNFTSAFILLAAGIGISLCALFIDLIYKNTCKKKFKKSSGTMRPIQCTSGDEELSSEKMIFELRKELRSLKKRYNELEQYVIETQMLNSSKTIKGILKNSHQNSTDSEKRRRLDENETLL